MHSHPSPIELLHCPYMLSTVGHEFTTTQANDVARRGLSRYHFCYVETRHLVRGHRTATADSHSGHNHARHAPKMKMILTYHLVIGLFR
jgi:hypothetical protein